MARASVILVATVVSCVSIVDAVTRGKQTNNLINKVRELRAALRACWKPPSLAHEDMTISVRLSFKQNGEILGVPLITYMSVGISEDERQAYRAAVDETLARCTPLPLSYAFGSVIAGRPINVRFHQRRALNGGISVLQKTTHTPPRATARTTIITAASFQFMSQDARRLRLKSPALRFSFA
jgi:hypothetical protein